MDRTWASNSRWPSSAAGRHAQTPLDIKREERAFGHEISINRKCSAQKVELLCAEITEMGLLRLTCADGRTVLQEARGVQGC